MATKKKQREPEAGQITRRRKGERGGKRLDPDLEAFARSDDKRFRPPRAPRGPRLNDPRPVYLVPGVANRDARAVLEAHSDRLRTVGSGTDFDRGLAEVLWLKLWRGQSLTSFAGYVEDVLQMPIDVARDAAKRYAESQGRDLAPFDDETIAIWLRAAAGALEAGGSLAIRENGGALEFQVKVTEAPEVLQQMGRRMSPLVQDRAPPEEPPRPTRKVEDAPPKRRKKPE